MSKRDRFAPTAEELALQEDYELALDDAEKNGEPWFSLDEFKARASRLGLHDQTHQAVPEVIVGDEEIPF